MTTVYLVQDLVISLDSIQLDMTFFLLCQRSLSRTTENWPVSWRTSGEVTSVAAHGLSLA